MKNLFITENFKKLNKLLPILKIQFHVNDISVVINKNNLIPILIFLKNNIQYQFKVLTCISGVDYPNKKYRFELTYELLSVRYNNRLRVKIFSDEISPIKSINNVYSASNWYEAEIWDMFGIFFTNHPNLSKLLTDYGFEGYPLRKDFPLTGFVESSYDYVRKRVVNEKVELSQEYRSFKFESPWEILDLN
jgi:NADH/F420H2 dehydrogenase subunit C